MTTSKRSQHPKDPSILQLSVFPVKTSQLQVDNLEWEKKLDQDCFTSAYGYLGKFDLSSPSLKTLEIYSPLKKGGYSKKSSFKLPNQGILQNGALFQQKMWEAATFDKESGSLPTPTNQTAGKGEFLKTLVTKDGKPAKIGERAYNPKTGKHVQITLDRAVAMNLPTPTTRDYKDSGENMNYKKAAEKKRLAGVLNHTHSNLTGEGTYLNPQFVEEMMGFPIGWTDLNA